MPIFEYKCKSCGKVFDELVRDCQAKVKCPECGSESERKYSGKIYTATGKGSGGCGGNCSSCGGKCK